mmetsp:Transcript_5976/g.8935  ORF Transcript_5976/g.8935 Transcript_5976/m.8935 type:complete len:534 (+) Transcript_5976:132-1733(+)
MNKSDISSVFDTCEKLSGEWGGWSARYSSLEKKTFWEDLKLKFDPHKMPIVISGSGVSVWTGPKTNFTISGTMQLSEKNVYSAILVKIHTGEYTSRIAYTGQFNVLKMEFKGEDSRGLVQLKRKSQKLKIDIPKMVKNSPPVLNRPLSLKLQKKVPKLSSVSGKWEGQSTSNKRGEVTLWVDCIISFENMRGMTSFVRGTGTSIWRNKEIPFRIEGTIDAKARSGSLVKTHTGNRIRNSIAYNVVIDPSKGVINGSNSTSKFSLSLVQRMDNMKINRSYVFQGSPGFCELKGSSDQGYYSHIGSLQEVPASSTTMSRNSYVAPSTPVREKSHSSAYSVNTTPRDPLELSAPYISQEARDPTSGSYYSGASQFFSGSGWAGKINSPKMTKEESKSLRTNFLQRNKRIVSQIAERKDTRGLEQYKAFLQGVVLSKKIGIDQQEALAKFRKKHQITSAEHISILKEIGLSEAIYEEMKIADKEIEDDLLCKICYEREMDCALLPCGHMVCQQCSKRIHSCPHCRKAFTRVQKLFKS